MSKRIEAVERRLDDIEKAIAVLQALILSDDGYGENRQVTTPVGAVSGEETDGKEDTGGGETRPVAEADAREAIGRSGRKAAGRAAETPGLVHNSLGDPYSIKLVYPTFYRSLDVGIPYCTVSFPSGKERLAKQVQEGTPVLYIRDFAGSAGHWLGASDGSRGVPGRCDSFAALGGPYGVDNRTQGRWGVFC
ncbi:MAG: hypothetical protein ACOX5Q_01395 [Bacillota bacterium]